METKETNKRDRGNGTLLAIFIFAILLIGAAFYLAFPLMDLFGLE